MKGAGLLCGDGTGVYMLRKCTQDRTLIMFDKFGAYRTKFALVTATSCFMASDSKWPPRHINTVQRKLTIFTMKLHQGVEAFLTTK